MSTVDPGLQLTEQPVAPEPRRRRPTDALFHGSFHLMLATVVTGALGYLYWTLAARGYTANVVGLAAGAVTAATAISLAVHLGPAALLVERLPTHEGTDGWGRRIWTAAIGTGALSAVLAALALLVAGRSPMLGGAGHSVTGWISFVVGCAAWSFSNMLAKAFFAARKAGQTSRLNGTISLIKLLLLGALLTSAVNGVDVMIGAWAASAVVGSALAALWQARRVGLPLGRPRLLWPTPSAWRSALGHHLTSVGGALTPYLLPPLVAVLLSPVDNAYFYLTWMLGGLFFMVSPAVAFAVFAEGIRDPQALAGMLRRSVRIIALLLVVPVLVCLAGGHWILGVFGADYASHGYGLLVLLLVSTVPDAITNLAVGAYRVTGQLGRSTGVNLGMAALTLIGTLLLARPLGVAGVGWAWLIAQTVGSLWVLRSLLRITRVER